MLFDGSGSNDPDGGLLRYRWDFGDGTTADIVNPTKTYRKGAVYPVTLTVEDESSFAHSSHTDRLVVKVDKSPIAEAGPDQEVCAGTEVHFDGSGSRDFDGVVNRFTWDFGDGDVGGGDKPVHVFRKPGNYRVLLTIEGDQAGQCDNTSTDEVSVQVAAARSRGSTRPTASRSAARPRSRLARMGGIAGYRWDFGDGRRRKGRLSSTPIDKPGVYVATLSVEPAAGATACSVVSAQHRSSPTRRRSRMRVRIALWRWTRRSASTARLVRSGRSGQPLPVGLRRRHSGMGMVARHRYRDSGVYTVSADGHRRRRPAQQQHSGDGEGDGQCRHPPR